MNPEHLTIALALPAVPAVAVQLTRVMMLRIALQGSKPSERAAILRGLAAIQPFNRSATPVDSARRAQARAGNRLPGSQREAETDNAAITDGLRRGGPSRDRRRRDQARVGGASG